MASEPRAWSSAIISPPRPAKVPAPSSGSAIDLAASRAAAGDRGAAGRLLALLEPAVRAYCRRRLSNHLLFAVDDVVQETCLGVLQALSRYREPGTPFMPVVYGIAAHKVADVIRDRTRTRCITTAAPPDRCATGDGPEQQALRADQSARLTALLDELPRYQRKILLLRIVAGLSSEETAAAVGSTSGAVRVAQYRAIRRLRAVLGADQSLRS